MKFNKSGFTLIELLIAITIFMILVVMTFVPYQYYSNIAKVKLAAKEISQSISEARNLAINGYDKNGKNQSIMVFFDKSSNKINFYSYDYSSGILNVNFREENILKTKQLPENVFINDIFGREKIGVYFSSIYGNGIILDGDSNLINSDIIDINISFKNSRDPNLNKKITFYKKTNLTDY